MGTEYINHLFKAKQELDCAVLQTGQQLPIHRPQIKTERIKSRKYNNATSKYRRINDFSDLLNQGYRVDGFETIPGEATDETKLLEAMNEVIIFKDQNNNIAKRIITKKNTETYKELKYSTLKNQIYYKSLSDGVGVSLVSFVCSITENIHVKINFVYLDRETLEVSTHQDSVSLPLTDEFKFDIFLNRGTLCIAWKKHQSCSRWTFSGPDINRLDFPVEENLMDVYDMNLSPHFFSVTVKDQEFYDDVFSSDKASKRLCAYYSLATGARTDSKKITKEILQGNTMDFASDVILIDIPDHPIWMVLEWLVPDMTLSHVHFYREKILNQNGVTKVCVLDFQDLFADYATHFGKVNQLQSNITICRDNWQIYLWIAANHALIIDALNYQLVALLKTDLSKYKDFKNELYNFRFDIDNGREVTVFVERYNDVVHFSKFQPFSVEKPIADKESVVQKVSPSEYTLPKQQTNPLNLTVATVEVNC